MDKEIYHGVEKSVKSLEIILNALNVWVFDAFCLILQYYEKRVWGRNLWMKLYIYCDVEKEPVESIEIIMSALNVWKLDVFCLILQDYDNSVWEKNIMDKQINILVWEKSM